MSNEYIQLIDWSRKREPKRREKEDWPQQPYPMPPMGPPDIGNFRILDADDNTGRVVVEFYDGDFSWARIYLPKGTPLREILPRVNAVLGGGGLTL